MKIRILLVIVPLLLVAADDVKDELKKLEGTWKLVAGEEDGRVITDEELRDAPLAIIKGDTLQFKRKGDRLEEGAITIDPAKKQIDFVFKVRTTRIIKGLYQVDGDTLKFCLGAPNAERPAKFESKGAKLATFKRQKP
jgi:uncharacterized protein (TIGR03067 family)